jgi:hypothetical protein
MASDYRPRALDSFHYFIEVQNQDASIPEPRDPFHESGTQAGNAFSKRLDSTRRYGREFTRAIHQHPDSASF